MRERKSKKPYIFLIVVIVTTYIAYFGYTWIHHYDINSKPVTGQFPEMSYCENDSDCIIVRQDCCPCNNGGVSVSINRRFYEWWEEKMSSQCGEFFGCRAAYRCNSIPRCINNTCETVGVNVSKIEFSVINALSNSTYVSVIVSPDKGSIDVILKSLSSEEFKVRRIFDDWFSGEISTSGISKLSENPFVKHVDLLPVGHPT